MMKHGVWHGQVFHRVSGVLLVSVCACAMCLCTDRTAFGGTIVNL